MHQKTPSSTLGSYVRRMAAWEVPLVSPHEVSKFEQDFLLNTQTSEKSVRETSEGGQLGENWEEGREKNQEGTIDLAQSSLWVSGEGRNQVVNGTPFNQEELRSQWAFLLEWSVCTMAEPSELGKMKHRDMTTIVWKSPSPDRKTKPQRLAASPHFPRASSRLQKKL